MPTTPPAAETEQSRAGDEPADRPGVREPTEPSQELPVDRSPGAQRPRDARGARGDDGGRRFPDPVEAVQRPDNRAKLLLATAVMSLLSLLLLIWILTELTGADFQRVTVDGVPCVIEIGAEDDGVLYCQR